MTFWTAFMQQVSKHGDLFHFNVHGSKKVIKPLQAMLYKYVTCGNSNHNKKETSCKYERGLHIIT
jgi:hypothetical protein